MAAELGAGMGVQMGTFVGRVMGTVIGAETSEGGGCQIRRAEFIVRCHD